MRLSDPAQSPPRAIDSLDVLFSVVGSSIPSSRFRVMQFLPHLEPHGVRAGLSYGYGSQYNLHGRRIYGPAYKLFGRMRRAARTVAQASRWDVVFLQRTALPFTALPERLTSARNPRIIFDFDDAIFLDERGMVRGRRHRAFLDAIAASAHVVAGNQFLADHTAAPDKTTVVPTVIDTDRYRPAAASVSDRGTTVWMGWMGTASNFYQLDRIVPVLEQVLSARPTVRLRIVSNARFEPLGSHPGVEQVPWSAEHEIELLQSFDIGIMPLDDTPWSRGKCGFKLIQFMAVGKPVVASAVGVNNQIVSEGVSGHLVKDGDEWSEALISLIDSRAERERMAPNARRRIESSYSIHSVLPTLLGIMNAVGTSS
jgi:glycosyltransferase involved in cell wall biosynthesis